MRMCIQHTCAQCVRVRNAREYAVCVHVFAQCACTNSFNKLSSKLVVKMFHHILHGYQRRVLHNPHNTSFVSFYSISDYYMYSFRRIMMTDSTFTSNRQDGDEQELPHLSQIRTSVQCYTGTQKPRGHVDV
jgi:hypothetical protein